MVKKTDPKPTVPLPDPSACAPASKATSPAPALPEPGAEFGFTNYQSLLEGVVLSRPPKFPVGTTVPERVYDEIRISGVGISQFIEDAITGFDGDLRALVEAAGQLDAERKSARFDTGVRSISGRVPKAALTRLQGILAAFKGLRGMSLAKVLGGLVLLHLGKGSK